MKAAWNVRRLASSERVVAKSLFAMMAAVFEEERAELPDAYVDGLLGRSDLWVLAAFDGDAVVGGLTAHILPMTRSASSELFIYDVAVRNDYQRRGVGRAMIAHLMELGLAAGIEVSFVPAENEDEHAIEFYGAVGGEATPVTFFTFEATKGS